LARNYRWIGCEIDIVATKGETLIGVEVKARKQIPHDMTSAVEILPRKKLAALTRGMQAWIVRKRAIARNIRVDLALVIVSKGVSQTSKTKNAAERKRLRLYWFTDIVTLK